MNQTMGRLAAKRRDDGIIINSYGSEILHVFPGKPGPYDVAEAREHSAQNNPKTGGNTMTID